MFLILVLFIRRRINKNILTHNSDDSYLHKFNQTLNHSDESNQEFFEQYYYKIPYDGKAKCNILEISGESHEFYPAGNGTDLISRFAKKFKCNVYSLQHRFFGKSMYGPLNVSVLQYLTSDQALLDVLNFVNQTLDELPTLVVGGSYSGMLSARVMYELQRPKFNKYNCTQIKAAISSSGVVYPSENFTEFDLQDAISMGQECASLARKARIQIEELLETQEEYVWKLFDIDENYTLKTGEFFNYIGELFTLGLQYNNNHVLCDMLKKTNTLGGDIVVALADYSKGFFTENFGGPKPYSTKYMQEHIDGNQSENRAWFWMTCNELGYWQTGDYGRISLRGPKVTQDVFVQQCQDVFNKTFNLNTSKWIEERTANLASMTKHVIFTTASQDPWTWACVTPREVVNDDSFAYTYTGLEMGHCSDLRSPESADPIDLIRIRNIEEALIEKWLFN